MGDMSNERMIELMQMEDDASVGMVLADQLEWREIDGKDAAMWDVEAWYGNDYSKAWLRTEGERVDSDNEGLVELFWDRIISRWWHVQAGARHDFGDGPSRNWAAFGVQGLAPYWFEVEATAYVGEQGRTAARFSAEYELLLTQRLVLQPKVELDLYGKDDLRNGIGSGLSESEVGLRLRYEIRREFAPYVGVVWSRSYGKTADLARADGHGDDDVQFVVGLRAWF
jgi:copper resistance protein B